MTTVLRRMGIPSGVVINRAIELYPALEEFCQKEGLPVLLRIPFDRRIAELYSRGIPLAGNLEGFEEMIRELIEGVKRSAAL
jgi:MinD superfamily P-loop ATPase